METLVLDNQIASNTRKLELLNKHIVLFKQRQQALQKNQEALKSIHRFTQRDHDVEGIRRKIFLLQQRIESYSEQTKTVQSEIVALIEQKSQILSRRTR